MEPLKIGDNRVLTPRQTRANKSTKPNGPAFSGPIRFAGVCFVLCRTRLMRFGKPLRSNFEGAKCQRALPIYRKAILRRHVKMWPRLVRPNDLSEIGPGPHNGQDRAKGFVKVDVVAAGAIRNRQMQAGSAKNLGK